MTLKRYVVAGIPDGGVSHIIPGKGKFDVIPSQLTDERIDQLIEAGITKYFKRKKNGNKKSKADSGSGTNTGSSANRTDSSRRTGNTTGFGSGTVGTDTVSDDRRPDAGHTAGSGAGSAGTGTVSG